MAYTDFKLMAEIFRTWQTSALRGARQLQEQNRALYMYVDAINHHMDYHMMAMLRAWANIIRRKEAAVFHWAKKSWRTCFRHWKLTTKYSQGSRQQLDHPVMIFGALLLRRDNRGELVTILDLCSQNYAPEVRKPTRRRELRRAQGLLRAWFCQMVFSAWVEHTDECFRALSAAGRHWKLAGAKYFLQLWQQRARHSMQHRLSVGAKLLEQVCAAALLSIVCSCCNSKACLHSGWQSASSSLSTSYACTASAHGPRRSAFWRLWEC
jgi:hypothetical protein